jgi:hypothetical protein
VARDGAGGGAPDPGTDLSAFVGGLAAGRARPGAPGGPVAEAPQPRRQGGGQYFR